MRDKAYRGHDNNHQLDTIEALSTIFVGQETKDELAYGRTGQSQSVGCDFDVGFVFRAPVDKC